MQVIMQKLKTNYNKIRICKTKLRDKNNCEQILLKRCFIKELTAAIRILWIYMHGLKMLAAEATYFLSQVVTSENISGFF